MKTPKNGTKLYTIFLIMLSQNSQMSVWQNDILRNFISSLLHREGLASNLKGRKPNSESRQFYKAKPAIGIESCRGTLWLKKHLFKWSGLFKTMRLYVIAYVSIETYKERFDRILSQSTTIKNLTPVVLLGCIGEEMDVLPRDAMSPMFLGYTTIDIFGFKIEIR